MNSFVYAFENILTFPTTNTALFGRGAFVFDDTAIIDSVSRS